MGYMRSCLMTTKILLRCYCLLSLFGGGVFTSLGSVLFTSSFKESLLEDWEER